MEGCSHAATRACRTSVLSWDAGSATAMLMPACLTKVLCEIVGARAPARKEVDALASESIRSEDVARAESLRRMGVEPSAPIGTPRPREVKAAHEWPTV